MNKSDLKGLWMPSERLINNKLSDKEKIILSMIIYLSKDKGYCFATNNYFSDILNVTVLTGRKIIVDTYGGYARHGGGAFSGKDASKVDRSAAYMMRHIAKNIVANKYADKCELQVSYAIGMKEPMSIYINTFGTNKVPESEIIDIVKKKFDLTPQGIIKYLELQKPIYKKTTNYGHFGKEDLSWEKIVKI